MEGFKFTSPEEEQAHLETERIKRANLDAGADKSLKATSKFLQETITQEDLDRITKVAQNLSKKDQREKLAGEKDTDTITP